MQTCEAVHSASLVHPVDSVEEESSGFPEGSLPQLPSEKPLEGPGLEHFVVPQGAISIGTRTQMSAVTALERGRPPSERMC
jgi:hypothetical protein